MKQKVVFETRWMNTFREAKNEYREKAVRFRGCDTLRRCYVELAWKNRDSQRECKVKIKQTIDAERKWEGECYHSLFLTLALSTPLSVLCEAYEMGYEYPVDADRRKAYLESIHVN